MDLRVGTSGYSYPAWKGGFYPADLPARQMLRYYGEQFRTVEVNYTFRRMPTAALLEGWADKVPADFRFVLKVPDLITHKRRLKDVGEPLSTLLQVAGVLKDRRCRVGRKAFTAPFTRYPAAASRSLPM